MSTPAFQPLLFGGDINVYSVARAFHEAYGVKSIAYGKYISFPCAYSSIIDYRPCLDNEDAGTFLKTWKQWRRSAGTKRCWSSAAGTAM